MASDPFRVLGLQRDATQAEVKRAYRRLVKAFHPDTAGEAAMARFLEIQAAYEALVGSAWARPRATRARPGAPTAGEPWRADPRRAREARDAGWTRTRRGPAEGSAAGERSGSEGGAGRGRARNRATPGSTTYDGADHDPRDPAWSGASWYGATSGTYWTVNPREYADPRKHGPEYQARARRRAGWTGSESAEENPSAASDDVGASGTQTSAGARGSARWDRSTDAGTSSDSGPAPGASSGSETAPGPRASASATRQPIDRRRPRFSTVPPATGGPGVIEPHGGPSSGGVTGLLDDARRTMTGRAGLALVGWLPIGIVLGVALGESTGCSPVVEGCEGPFGLATVIGQGSGVALLLLLPRLAVIAALGTIAMFTAAVPSVAALSIAGGTRDPGAVVPALVVVLVVAWAIGIVVAVGRAGLGFAGSRRPPVP